MGLIAIPGPTFGGLFGAINWSRLSRSDWHLQIAGSSRFNPDSLGIASSDASGQFDVLGSTVVNSAGMPAIARFNADGTLDTSFGTEGVLALTAL
jgi:hypothetical protein